MATASLRSPIKFQALLLVFALLSPWMWAGPASAAIFVAPRTQAMWVYADPASATNPVAQPAARTALIAASVASHVDTLYVSVYRSSVNSAGRPMFEDADVASLIAQAHLNGIAVYAAYGNPDWPSFGCDSTGFPLQRLADVTRYNAANPAAAFDGLMLDIEPPAPPAPQYTAADYAALLAQYQCFQQQTATARMRFAASIRFGWKDPVAFGAAVKPFYQHAIDVVQPPNQVVVMGYRDFAGTADATSDGIIAADGDHIRYARSVNKTELIIAGLETSDPLQVGISGKETFFEEGQSVMNDVASVVINAFGYYSGLGGFAVHNYGSPYLSGSSPRWPAVNAEFPQFGNSSVVELPTPLGGPVTVTPPSLPGGANVSLTFPLVSGSPGRTYVAPLDPANTPMVPANYVSVAGLYFDISSTATFTAPVTVCFANLDVPAVDFPSLRVLHYISGGYVDETILTGPNAPSPATRTVCASTSGFSPFLVAQCRWPTKDKSGKPKKCRHPQDGDD